MYTLPLWDGLPSVWMMFRPGICPWRLRVTSELARPSSASASRVSTAPTSWVFFRVPYPTTTASLRAWVSGVREKSMTFPSATTADWLRKPSMEHTSVSPDLASMEYRPSRSVMTALDVPSIITTAPTAGSPDPASDTVPRMVCVCADSRNTDAAMTSAQKISFFIK